MRPIQGRPQHQPFFINRGQFQLQTYIYGTEPEGIECGGDQMVNPGFGSVFKKWYVKLDGHHFKMSGLRPYNYSFVLPTKMAGLCPFSPDVNNFFSSDITWPVTKETEW
ncbi:hypothetical protein [Anditalea andensis]|uniref:Uncharacterized protein n=1 Tax=Anditalea andensis TaxID=1048983 RepID=A0A074L738_9BACT|nr:hypothetical protein [Anditalea andensis]KEO75628.1 hypothetical protein EL17_24140 [Anditalea andensis]